MLTKHTNPTGKYKTMSHAKLAKTPKEQKAEDRRQWHCVQKIHKIDYLSCRCCLTLRLGVFARDRFKGLYELGDVVYKAYKPMSDEMNQTVIGYWRIVNGR